MKHGKPVLVVDNHAGTTGDDEAMAVCVVSLEGMGRTTGRLGSEAAGAASVEFAERLNGMLRQSDQLVQIHECKCCMLLRPLRDRNHAELAGQKLERLFAEPFVFRGQSVVLDVRAGIACGSAAGSDAEAMFRAAETARESALRREKVFELADEVVVADMHQRWQINDEIDDALARHQVKLYYQPKVTATDHRLCGAEALVRWNHPDGLMLPAQFLPYLERDKLRALTRHVIRQSVRDLAANDWLPPLSINLDPDLVERASPVQLILDELSVWGVDPRRLVVEMTESGIVRNVDRLREDFATLRCRGVRISMDDFGTGSSSLAQFRDLLVDEVKIDRSFVLDLHRGGANRYLAGVIIDLGHYFGMSVVAEGIECRETADELRDMRCDVLQGFHFSPPIPLEELKRWAAGRSGPPDCA